MFTGKEAIFFEHIEKYLLCYFHLNLSKEISLKRKLFRIGRTGRCGNIGRSTSFYDEKTDAHLAQSLLKVLSDAQQTVPDWLVDCAEQAKMSGYNSFRGGARMGGRVSSSFEIFKRF